MNNKKTLTSLAAASMVITQAGQMSVFAKGATVLIAKLFEYESE